jgi:hypothetical protein
MELVGKIMTLRGELELTDNARSVNNQVFSFEANILEKGWKVKDFYFWPAQLRALTGSTEGQLSIAATLATDSLDAALASFERISSVKDNRFMAWVQKGYNLRDSPVHDFISSPTGLYHDNQAIIDPDHVVNDALFINMYSTSDSSTSPTRLYNYMIVLEEMKLTPAQAILSLVKGKAQDVPN